MRLSGKIAIITGAGSGMGRATAELFAAEGARVICADISGKQDDVAEAIGDNARAIHADIADEDQVKAMIAAAITHFGRLDILINNAGFGGGMAPLHEQSTENWDRVHSVNIRGTFFCIKHGVIQMRAQKQAGLLSILARHRASSAGNTIPSMARPRQGCIK